VSGASVRLSELGLRRRGAEAVAIRFGTWGFSSPVGAGLRFLQSISRVSHAVSTDLEIKRKKKQVAFDCHDAIYRAGSNLADETVLFALALA
jgi:hypothetical protein